MAELVEINTSVILKSFLAGGTAGMCAKSTVAPLDRVKILLQAQSKHYRHEGVFSGLRRIVQKEKFLALYKGNGAQMVRMFPYAAIQFTSFEVYKKLFINAFRGRRILSSFASGFAGSLAGVTAVFVTYPLDTIRARLAFQVAGEHVYTGIFSTVTHIYQQEGGFRALYRGFSATICGMIPYAGLSFYCFEKMKYICLKFFPKYTCSYREESSGLVLNIPAKLLSGALAGAVAQSFSYPFDVARRRMQLAWMSEDTKKFGRNFLSTLRLVYRENGIASGLYRGMSINYLRAVPMVAVSFSIYELMKQTLGLETGLKIQTG